MKPRLAPRWLAIIGAVISLTMLAGLILAAIMFPEDHVDLNPQFRIINSAFYTGLLLGFLIAWLASVSWLCLKSAIQKNENGA
jgi:hypothetical protein